MPSVAGNLDPCQLRNHTSSARCCGHKEDCQPDRPVVRPRRADWERPRDSTSGSQTGPFTFIAPRRLSDKPLTRACVRLLGLCFKTGRVGSRHRRRPCLLGSALFLQKSGVTHERPLARQRNDARPDPRTAEMGGGGEVGERSHRGRGCPASTHHRPTEGQTGGKEGERGDGYPVPSAPGFGERCCRGAVTLAAGWLGAHGCAAHPPPLPPPPPPPSPPSGAFPAVPELVAAQQRRWKSIKNIWQRLGTGHGAVPGRPHPPALPAGRACSY
ncbi:hypothetical protein LEMLEM_LOCUS2536 [Lemmus lemmus]